MQGFFNFFRGKYTGILFSLLFIWLFTYMFHDLVMNEFKHRSPSNIFLVKTVQTWFILLSVIIIVQVLSDL